MNKITTLAIVGLISASLLTGCSQQEKEEEHETASDVTTEQSSSAAVGETSAETTENTVPSISDPAGEAGDYGDPDSFIADVDDLDLTSNPYGMNTEETYIYSDDVIADYARQYEAQGYDVAPQEWFNDVGAIYGDEEYYFTTGFTGYKYGEGDETQAEVMVLHMTEEQFMEMVVAENMSDDPQIEDDGEVITIEESPRYPMPGHTEYHRSSQVMISYVYFDSENGHG